MYKDSFGFINKFLKFKFDNCEIFPVENYKDIVYNIEKTKNADRFIYPPNVCDYRIHFDSPDREVIPNTNRPALLYQLPATHVIVVNSSKDQNYLRKNDAAFIIHFLGFLYGYRLQFYDWYFEGRVPIDISPSFNIHHKIANDVLHVGYFFWLNLSDKLKKILINCLFMHSKMVSYEWDWEKFSGEYMIFDALYKVISIVNKDFPKSKSHAGRIKNVCEFYNIFYNEETVEKIVTLRNELFHEILWDGSYPTSGNTLFACYAADHLHRLSSRLIFSLIGYNNEFSKSNWEGLVKYYFDPI